MINDRIEESLRALALAETDDFVALAKTAGLNPRKDFVGADLRGCDFSFQDMSNFDLRKADLRRCGFKETVFRRSLIEGARFSTDDGYIIVADRKRSRTVAPERSLSYADTIAEGIRRITGARSLANRLQMLERMEHADPRASVRRFASSAFRYERELSAGPSVVMPTLMNLGLSQIYPMARQNLIQSYIKILGSDRHARAFLESYYLKRATSSKTKEVLRRYLAV